MAHRARIRSPGMWTPLSVFYAVELELLDQAQFTSPDFDNGGVWAPSSAVVVGGSGIDVTGTFAASGTTTLSGATTMSGAVTASGAWTFSNTVALSSASKTTVERATV